MLEKRIGFFDERRSEGVRDRLFRNVVIDAIRIRKPVDVCKVEGGDRQLDLFDLIGVRFDNGFELALLFVVKSDGRMLYHKIEGIGVKRRDRGELLAQLIFPLSIYGPEFANTIIILIGK